MIDNCTNGNYKETFFRPFYLFPKYRTCPKICGVRSRLDAITFDADNEYLYQGVMNATLLKNKPYMYINGTKLHQYLCYFEPVNEVDEIVLNTEKFITLNIYQEFNFNVAVSSKSRLVNTGVDSELDLNIELRTMNCTTQSWKIHLVSGKGILKGKSNCNPGNGTLRVSATTNVGLLIETYIHILFTPTFNSIYFLNGDLYKACNYLPSQSIDSLVKLFCYQDMYELFYRFPDIFETKQHAPERIHHIAVIEREHNLKTISSLAFKLNVPIYIFDLFSSFNNKNGLHNERFLSAPSANNLRIVMGKNQVTLPGVVIFRMSGRITLAEFYAIYQSTQPLLKDVIVRSDGFVDKRDVSELKKYPKCKVFLFLDSEGTSNLFGHAMHLKVTPLQGYHWYSFAENYVISNSFLHETCQRLKPACHVPFQNMMHIFQNSTLTKCPLSPVMTKILSVPIRNITTFIRTHLVNITLTDINKAVDYSIRKIFMDNKIPTFEKILNETDNIFCLPSTSGLQFTLKTPWFQTLDLSRSNYVCQPGWSGDNCNIPSCSIESCNATNGICIAPDLCLCHKDWFGKGCKGDCKITCLNNGVCNDGTLGDGTCKSCKKIYHKGKDCNESSLIFLIVAVIGAIVIQILIILYLYRFFRFREFNEESKMQVSDSQYMMNWEDFESIQDVMFSSKQSKELVAQKLTYIAYQKARTYAGKLNQYFFSLE